MTSTRLELDQLAQGLFFWPVRALDRGLRHAGVRRAVKVGVDFCCGAAAVVTAVAVSEGIPTVGSSCVGSGRWACRSPRCS